MFRPSTKEWGILIAIVMIAAGFVMCGPAASADISAMIDRSEVALGDQVVLTVTVSGEGQSLPQPSEPNTDGFQVADISNSNSFSFVNGRVSATRKTTYVLSPTKTGIFTIRPGGIQSDGRIVQASPIQVRVLAGRPTPGNASPADAAGEGGGGSGDLFIETEVDQERPIVNQQVTLTFRFFRAKELFRNPDYEPPSTQGFTMEQLTKQQSSRRTINGKLYLVEEIKYALFPIFSGRQTIGPAALTYYERVRGNRPRRRGPFDDPFFEGFFDDPFAGGGNFTKHRLTTAPIVLDVQPLPGEGRPEGFANAVGEYRISAVADKNTLKAGEALSLRVIVSGYGQVKTIGEPVLKLPDGFSKFDTKDKENQGVKDGRVFCSKTYEYVLIPRREGDFTIGPLSFPYYDPVKKSYEVSKTGDFPIKVLPGDKMITVAAAGNGGGRDVELLAEDIKFIKTEAALVPLGDGPYGPRWVWGTLCIPLILFFLSLLWKSYHDRYLSDPVLVRRRNASKNAFAALDSLESNCHSTSGKDYFTSLSKIVIGFVSDRLDLSASGLTTDEVVSSLGKTGLDDNLRTRVADFIEECYLQSFSSTSTGDEGKKDALSKAKSLIDSLSDLSPVSARSQPARARGTRMNCLLGLAMGLAVLCSVPAPVHAGQAQLYFEEANRHYREGRYEDAVKVYDRISKDLKILDPAVLYNTGNAWFKLGKLGKARLYYEKAVKLAPADRDTLDNISFLKNSLEDKIEIPEPSFAEALYIWWDSLFSSWGLVLLTLVSAHCLLVCPTFALFSQSRRSRRRIVAFAVISLLVLAIFGGTLIIRRNVEADSRHGVIQSEAVDVLAEPSMGGKVKFTLHEGAVVKVNKVQGLWYQISLPNGFFGWIEKIALERI